MRESDLRQLLEQGADRTLVTLEADIWAGIAAQAQAHRVFKRVFAAQVVVLAVAVLGSNVIGRHLIAAGSSTQLDIFSPRPALAASTLLLGQHP
jgi:hypothetical protein